MSQRQPHLRVIDGERAEGADVPDATDDDVASEFEVTIAEPMEDASTVEPSYEIFSEINDRMNALFEGEETVHSSQLNPMISDLRLDTPPPRSGLEGLHVRVEPQPPAPPVSRREKKKDPPLTAIAAIAVVALVVGLVALAIVVMRVTGTLETHDKLREPARTQIPEPARREIPEPARAASGEPSIKIAEPSGATSEPSRTPSAEAARAADPPKPARLSIISPSDGVVVTLRVEENATVESGALLVEMIDPESHRAIADATRTYKQLADKARRNSAFEDFAQAAKQKVKKAQKRAHKMLIAAPRAGKIARAMVLEGASVKAGQLLFEIE